MSRIANSPVTLPSGVDVTIDGGLVSVKGSKGSLEFAVDSSVEVSRDENVLRVASTAVDRKRRALAGTTRSILNNMVVGVSQGFTRSLLLQGVGYRANVRGKKLVLSLGFSHPVEYAFPEGIEIECPSQTEVVVKGIDKQQVGQTCAEIRKFRPPEPYKGKGVRYADEYVRRKESKKK